MVCELVKHHILFYSELETYIKPGNIKCRQNNDQYFVRTSLQKHSYTIRAID